MTKKWALKLAILGDAAVGKTSLINNYITHSFNENYQPTLGVNIVTKDIRLKEYNSDWENNTSIPVTIWLP